MKMQYNAIKAEHPDCLLFYRLGDFYEMFDEDAKLTARELDLTLTTRDRGKPKEEQTPMCGVPFHAVDGYVNRLIEKGYKEVDINIGCPFPMLAKRHNGSGILPYPEEVQALLSLITEYPQISFSIKMRLGWEDPEECLKLAPIINELPLRQVVMHPRLGKQQYKGEVDLKAFEAFQNACKHPLIYNGDINSVEDIHRIQEQFPGLAGMMIGRGLLANPALALEYRQNRALEFDEMREKLQSMHKCVYNQYAEQLEGGDEQLLNKMKTFWEYLMPQADRKLLKAIHKSTSLNKYNQAILAFFNQR